MAAVSQLRCLLLRGHCRGFDARLRVTSGIDEASRNTLLACVFQPNFTRAFSSTRTAMAGTKIDGNAVAKSIRERLAAQIQKTQQTNPRYKPSLVIIQGAYD